MSNPGLFILSGPEGLLRRRWLQANVENKRKHGWNIEYVDAREKGQLMTALVGDVLFAEATKTLVIVEHPEKGDLSLYEERAALKNPDVALLLHIEGSPRGNTKFGKLVKKLKKLRKDFPSPKQWDAEGVAAQFFVDEIERLGKEVPLNLAAALVTRVGADLGVLAFEALKIATLADVEGCEKVTAQHIKEGMAEIADAAVSPILDALKKRSAPGMARGLTRYRKNAKGDPTIGICRLLGDLALKWFCAKDLKERGVPAKDAAARMGANLWYYENKLLPECLRWNRLDLIRLVRALAEGERALLSGHQQPWLGLTASLLFLCPRGGSR